MIRTLKIPYMNRLSENDTLILEGCFKEYNSSLRSAYSLINKGLSEKEVRLILKDREYDSIDSWFIQSSIYQAKQINESNKSLKIDKFIFGGRKNFILRSKNKITSQEYKNKRNHNISSIGEAPKKGNRKFNFYSTYIEFKPFKGCKIKFELPNLKNSYRKLYNKMVELANLRKTAVQVKISRDGFLYLTFDYSKAVNKSYNTKIKGIVAGIDMNPNYIGISILDSNNSYNVLKTKMFSLKELTTKRSSNNKLEHETIEIAHSIGRWLKHNHVEHLFLEDLNFKNGNKGLGKSFNRLVINKWKRNLFTSILEKYFDISSVNAAYSSTIGNILNDGYPDPIAASIEIARRGCECFIKKSRKFYPELVSIKKLADRWKETVFPEISSWKELHDFLKNSKMMYRVSLPEEEFYSEFKSKRSKVKLYDFTPVIS